MAFRRDNETWNKKHSEFLISIFAAPHCWWLRRRRGKTCSSFLSTCSWSTNPEPGHHGQLAIQHDVHGRDASLDNFRKHHTIADFTHWRSACGGFEKLSREASRPWTSC